MSTEYIIVPSFATNNKASGNFLIVGQIENNAIEQHCEDDIKENKDHLHLSHGFDRVLQQKMCYRISVNQINYNKQYSSNQNRYREIGVDLKYLNEVRNLYEIIDFDGDFDDYRCKIPSSKEPLTKFVYVYNKGFLYGYFEWKREDGIIMLLNKDNVQDKPLEYVYRYKKDDVLRCVVKKYQREFFFENINERNNAYSVDLSTNLEKINYLFKNYGQKTAFDEKIKEVKGFTAHLDTLNVQKNDIAKERLNCIEKKFEGIHVVGDDGVDTKVKDLFKKFLAANADFAKDVVKEFTGAGKKGNSILKEMVDQEIEKKNIEREEVDNEHVLLLKKKVQQLESDLSAVSFDKQNVLQSNETDVKTDEEKIKLENLKKEVLYWEAVNSDIRKELKENEIDLIKKITKSKRDFKHIWLEGKDFDYKCDYNLDKVEYRLVNFSDGKEALTNMYYKYKNVCSEENIKSCDKNDFINFVILYSQSLLCFYAGMPGEGKSLFCDIFSRVLGAQKHIVNVPKGWDDNQDFIGYDNPFSSSFQEGSSKFLSFAKNNNNNVLPLLCVLDEANLSQLEYYWSDFIGGYDKFIKDGLAINGVGIPKSMRFIGTINYDNTTQDISQRLLDRSPVVVFGRDLFKYDNNGFDDVGNIDECVSYETLNNLFSGNGCIAFEKIEEEIIKSIQNLYPISQRKINIIKKYCSTSRNLFSNYYPEDGLLGTPSNLVALDYCIKQNILTSISGHGEVYREMLDRLRDLLVVENLKMSEELLSKIIENGSKYKNYSFFFWR